MGHEASIGVVVVLVTGLQFLAATDLLRADMLAVGIHTTAMLVAMGVVAILVYDRLGLGVLRKAWLN